MKAFLITELAEITEAHCETDIDSNIFFTGVSTDSRTIKAADCFFAIAGENFDGHNYVYDAFDNGAVCAVVSRDEKFTGGSILRVNDTIKALGDLAREYRRRMNFKVAAITGSVGKTTTRQIVHHVLSRHFSVHQSQKNFNNNIGLPLTLLGAEVNDEIIIAELGSNYPGEIAYLTGITQPDIAVVTNVYPSHLSGFGNLETITKEKLSISEGLREGGVFIINGDIERIVNASRNRGVDFRTFGRSKDCDIRGEDIVLGGSESRFTIDGNEITLPLAGRGNVENALAAWAVCRLFGISMDDFIQDLEGLRDYAGIMMRAQLMEIGTLTVLNDCYNANPASMQNALEILVNLKVGEERRRVFICGDMAELGGQSEELHNELGERIAEAKVQLLLAVGESAAIAAERAKSSAGYNLQTKCFKDTLSACNNLQEFIKDYDVILVKGSRSSKLEQVIEKLKDFFSRMEAGSSKVEPRETR